MQLATALVTKESETIASERAPKPPPPKQKSKLSDMDVFSKLERYQEDQNEKKVLKPSGYVFRSISQYGCATCFMYGKTLRSTQGFADHVQNCSPDAMLVSVVPTELVLGSTSQDDDDSMASE